MYWKVVYGCLMTKKISFKFYSEDGYDTFEYADNKVQVTDEELILNGEISDIERIIENIAEAV